MAIRGIGLRTGLIVPHLSVRGVPEAIEFYCRALGAVELYRSPLPFGQGFHAQLRIGNAQFFVTDESPDPGMRARFGGSPQTLGGTSVALQIYVDDVDAAFQRAIDGGGLPILTPQDAFHGDRYSMLKDPFGHSWAIVTVKEELSPEQVHERMMKYVAQTGTSH